MDLQLLVLAASAAPFMMAQAEEPAGEAVGGPLLNINVGVLGHIDSGKTSLAKAMSTVSSTASFDRSPQEKARGITLDLGFSCLRVATPQHIQGTACCSFLRVCHRSG